MSVTCDKCETHLFSNTDGEWECPVCDWHPAYVALGAHERWLLDRVEHPDWEIAKTHLYAALGHLRAVNREARALLAPPAEPQNVMGTEQTDPEVRLLRQIQEQHDA